MLPKNNMISKKRKKRKTIFKTKQIKKGQINYKYKLGNYIIRCITAVIIIKKYWWFVWIYIKYYIGKKYILNK